MEENRKHFNQQLKNGSLEKRRIVSEADPKKILGYAFYNPKTQKVTIYSGLYCQSKKKALDKKFEKSTKAGSSVEIVLLELFRLIRHDKYSTAPLSAVAKFEYTSQNRMCLDTLHKASMEGITRVKYPKPMRF